MQPKALLSRRAYNALRARFPAPPRAPSRAWGSRASAPPARRARRRHRAAAAAGGACARRPAPRAHPRAGGPAAAARGTARRRARDSRGGARDAAAPAPAPAAARRAGRRAGRRGRAGRAAAGARRGGAAPGATTGPRPSPTSSGTGCARLAERVARYEEADALGEWTRRAGPTDALRVRAARAAERARLADHLADMVAEARGGGAPPHPIPLTSVQPGLRPPAIQPPVVSSGLPPTEPRPRADGLPPVAPRPERGPGLRRSTRHRRPGRPPLAGRGRGRRRRPPGRRARAPQSRRRIGLVGAVAAGLVLSAAGALVGGLVSGDEPAPQPVAETPASTTTLAPALGAEAELADAVARVRTSVVQVRTTS